MHAEHLLLTHFSQRYPKLARIGAVAGVPMGIAFDMMHMTPAQLRRLVAGDLQGLFDIIVKPGFRVAPYEGLEPDQIVKALRGAGGAVIDDRAKLWQEGGDGVLYHTAIIMKALKGVDEVAYVRYASVYKDFRHTGDFAKFLGDEGFDEPSGKA